jgi:hypothetical protein
MDKLIFNLVDDVFSHDRYSVAGRDSLYIEWDRTLKNKNNPTFYSHNRMFNNITESDSYGLLFESKSIVPFIYKNVKDIVNKFERVFTHDSELLKNFDNCFWIPGGGVWIGGTYGGGTIEIKKKDNLCSLVSSSKKMCELHNLRLSIAKDLTNSQVTVFGLEKWTPINETLDSFMFSIVIENYQDEMYFTEKILNCFATGTIPIYLGARNINEKFNGDGIIQFNSMEELYSILPKLNSDLYYKKIKAIEDNHNRCKEYLSIEDYIYINYFK